ncbi:hypothetical protein CBS147321_7838 [Aspergillus niger]|nr:hypothetical protein CBS147321_7838 [Aspergillus niger]KAI2973395.1 hypothetical protein CBS147323_1916 [Aspergillus niger]KAI3027821.1 hypothetical protein CBS147347_4301 [Aspergillus niger]KAI3028044.1 hypothetical protein CBS147482_558 [Aspergillus niger]KAI3067323.1 hypothetical protein CBS147353_7729 [Aspergillus niger]
MCGGQCDEWHVWKGRRRLKKIDLTTTAAAFAKLTSSPVTPPTPTPTTLCASRIEDTAAPSQGIYLSSPTDHHYY